MVTNYIDYVEPICSIIGVGYGIYLFKKNNRLKHFENIEKMMNIFYNDEEIRTVLYAVDSGNSEEIYFGKSLEKEGDKTITKLNVIGYQLYSKNISIQDVEILQFEILKILENETVIEYIKWLKNWGLKLDYISYLKNEVKNIQK